MGRAGGKEGRISDRAIPYAVNKHGDVFEPENAPAGHHYLCPQCGMPVINRDGPIRIEHFAHKPTDVPCDWKTAAETKAELRNARERVIQYYSRKDRLRIFVAPDSEDQFLSLLTQLPALTEQDVVEFRNRRDEHIQVNAVGIEGSLSAEDFAVGVGVRTITLDPAANHYQIQIAPDYISIAGTWKAPRLAPGQTFVGNDWSAERVDDPRFITSGRTCYYILAGTEQNLPSASKILRMGAFRVAKFYVDRASLAFLKARFPRLLLDSLPMRVDVVLPLDQAPSQQERGIIEANPGEETLIVITPPGQADPVYEIIPLPFNNDLYQIPAAGPGRPRFLQIQMPEARPKSLLVIWPDFYGREVLLQMVPVQTSGATSFALQPFEYGVSTEHGKQTRTVMAATGGELVVNAVLNAAGEPRPAAVALRAPPGFRVQVDAVVREGNRTVEQDRGQATAATLSATVEGLFLSGAESVTIGFGTLGRITLRCPFLTARVASPTPTRASQPAPASTSAPPAAPTLPRALAHQTSAEQAAQLAAQRQARQREESLAAARRNEAADEKRRQEGRRQQFLQRVARLAEDHVGRLPHHISRRAAAEVLGLSESHDADELDEWRPRIKKRVDEIRKRMHGRPKPEPILTDVARPPPVPDVPRTTPPQRPAPPSRPLSTPDSKPRAPKIRKPKPVPTPRIVSQTMRANRGALTEIDEKLKEWAGSPKLERGTDAKGRPLEPTSAAFVKFLQEACGIDGQKAAFLLRAQRRKIEALIRQREEQLK